MMTEFLFLGELSQAWRLSINPVYSDNHIFISVFLPSVY